MRGLAVCGVLEPEELRQLAALVHEVDYSKQQTIFLEGDDEGGLFIVTHGVAMIYKLLADGRRQVTGFLYPGDHFGMDGYLRISIGLPEDYLLEGLDRVARVILSAG